MKELNFPTTLTDTPRFISNPGEPIKDIYKAKLDKNGNRVVVKVGKQNLAEFINSFKDQVDIQTLIARFNNGDVEALNRRKALFIDTTELPDNYFDAINKINEAKDDFRKLPADIKAKFDYDADKYVGAIGSDEWIKALTKEEPEFIKETKNELEKKVENEQK